MTEVTNLVKRYKDLIALDHFNLSVKDGEIFGLLGPNGSGKTTAINCILSLLKYDKGEIYLFGKPMTPESYDIKQKIGVVMQNVAVFNELTVAENVDYFCGLYVGDQKKRRELVEEALVFTSLQDYRKFRPRKLSGGLLRRLNIACGIAHKPELIFLDEPTVAVDPQSRNSILEGIRRLNQQGATIVYTSHYMEEVEQICSRIMIMDHGHEVATGTKEELKSMIRTGEKLTIEVPGLPEALLQQIRKLDGILTASYDGEKLLASCRIGDHAIIEVLDLLRKNRLVLGRVFSEPPTLNDVFLEITGKQLRD
ncbi:MAG: ABC transporter ATP-binding protein [Lachnospiraceae bacterium]|nr:ABC transporter ATP-binding protein [Lachnospiraceae bacterium]